MSRKYVPDMALAKVVETTVQGPGVVFEFGTSYTELQVGDVEQLTEAGAQIQGHQESSPVAGVLSEKAYVSLERVLPDRRARLLEWNIRAV